MIKNYALATGAINYILLPQAILLLAFLELSKDKKLDLHNQIIVQIKIYNCCLIWSYLNSWNLFLGRKNRKNGEKKVLSDLNWICN